jgi:hypothetical protein
MKEVAGGSKRPLARGSNRENGLCQRPEGDRLPSADAPGGVALMTRLVETPFAEWRQA